MPSHAAGKHDLLVAHAVFKRVMQDTTNPSMPATLCCAAGGRNALAASAGQMVMSSLTARCAVLQAIAMGWQQALGARA